MIKHNLDLYKDQAPIRRLAFREFGDVTSENILLCIPGILESQNAFDEIVNFVEQHEGCRLITVDHCGRGKSDWLDEGSTYKMSVYLEDLRTLIAHLHATHVDISYSFNFLGLHFDNGLQNFKGPVLLLRGKNSDICSSIDEQVLMRYANHAEVMSLDGEGHPVSYGPEVLSKLSEILNLHKISISLPNDLFSTEYQNYETYSMLACA